MKNKRPPASFAPHEIQRFIYPITLSFICLITGVILTHLINDVSVKIPLLIYGIAVLVYSWVNNNLIVRSPNYSERYGLGNSIVSGVGLGLFIYLSTDNIREAAHIVILLGFIAIAVASGRFHSYLTMTLSLLVSLPFYLHHLNSVAGILEFGVPYISGFVVIESVLRIKDTTQEHIHRLETINKISRQIMLSLETHQTMSLLNATMQEALEADTYFVGTLQNNDIQLDLFYDEGEYFNGMRVPIEGTLSGWVIRNQRELFLPDLREEVELDGVARVVIGQEKTSLSWIGVPLKASNITGVMALGAYRPNAFDRGDMELLSNLAQHVALALDNTIRHAQVEEQARLDSLTGVFNHGYFLKKLEQQTQEALSTNKPLSLIMLDIDYFKQFNDSYGHLVGDRILKTLCTAIKHHVKQTDAVGRWGGEEFAISLPGATGADARRVAERIGQTMAMLQIEDREQNPIPVPTVSQGIAVFPSEAQEVFPLIDLADRRLYVAKVRGRNQVEPDASYWESK
jgi:diguanylate cyclase (GGDEF)-like protein